VIPPVEQRNKSVRGKERELVDSPGTRTHGTQREFRPDAPVNPAGSSDLFFEAMDDLGIGIAITEGARFLYVNNALCAMYGYTRDALLSLPSFLQLVPEEDREKLLRNLTERQEKKTAASFGETGVIRSDGERIRIEYSLRVFEKDGKKRMYSFIREITERSRYETRNRLLAAAVASTSEIISITDHENRFTFVNKAFLEVYGYTQEEVLGRHPGILTGGPEGDSIVQTVWRKTREESWCGELLNRRKDGTVLPIHLSTSPILNADGSVLGYVGVARNITQEKAAEAMLLEAERRFRRLLSMESDSAAGINDAGQTLPTAPPKGLRNLAEQIHTTLDTVEESIRHVLNFSSFASHELRNPLTVIRSSLESALSWDTPVDELRGRLIQVYNEILHLIHMVELLLDVARMHAGTLALRLQPINLALFVKEFMEEAGLICSQKGIRCKLETAPEASISGDRNYLHQVFFNLLDNACKHTPAGGRIDLGYTVSGNEVVLRFADTGYGILPGELPKIFEPFFKGSDIDSRNARGAGLGLALVKWIVEAHSGSVRAESRIGLGTVIEIHLPVSPA
jgi:PAS domain S-box-containing protein